jgi:guanylate kinase
MSGNLFIVTAPSGAGKTSLVRALLAADPQVRLSVSYTTRPPRPGETDGRDYHFVSPERFAQMLEAGEFLESAVVHGNRYGTGQGWIAAQRDAGHDIILEIDWQGAQQVRRVLPDAVGIFILPPSLDALEERLFKRGQDTAEVIMRRLASAREEVSHVGEFDYVIINQDFERAAQELASVVRTHRLKAADQLKRWTALLAELQH